MAKAYDRWRSQALELLEREPELGAQRLMEAIGAVGKVEYGTVYKWVRKFREENKRHGN
jgi:hypothetical protein